MSEDRPAIPRPLARSVKVEAGHRCAVPTCRQTSGLEIHHIEPWSKVREHTFENLILLCAICHSRTTNGEIDTLAMKQYKANLDLITDRYGETERRLLEWFMNSHLHDTIVLDYSTVLDMQLMYVLQDGIVQQHPMQSGGGIIFSDASGSRNLAERRAYSLTPAGKELVANLVRARPID